MINLPPNFYSTGDFFQGVSYYVSDNTLVLLNWPQTLTPQDFLLPLPPRYGVPLNQNRFLFQSQVPAFYNVPDIKPLNLHALTEPTFSCSSHRMNQNSEVQNHPPPSLAKNNDPKNTMRLLRYEEIKVAKLTQRLEKDLEGILNSILNQNGRKTSKEVERDLANLAHNDTLSQIYNQVLLKYQKALKVKEDTVRLILRKALTWIRDEVRVTENLSAKAASLVLCKRYFRSKIKELEASLNDDELLNFLLPYKKNSRNKTANTAFATEIFASEEFYKDYNEFLANIEKILETENIQRKRKFLDFLLDCVKKSNFDTIQAYKRLPWSETWIESIKIVASQLINRNSVKTLKKMKRAYD